jgi:protein ImuB
MRIACARVRDAPLAALARREPDLLAAPVAVVDTAGAHGRVVACTARAREAGVALGQTAHQARAVAPEVVVRVADAGALVAMRAALADAAASVAARVEPDGDRVYLDVSEVCGLYRSERGFVAALAQAAGRVGLELEVGIADTKGVARVAASRRVGGAIVPPGGARAFLAPLPLDVLPLSSRLRAELVRLGVRTVGALAALPLEATGVRLGAEAARAIALARGEDSTPLFARPHATRFEEAAELDWEVTDVGALAFVVKRLADALVARLACRALAAAGVTLALTLVTRARDERTLTLAAPTRDVPTLVHLARASFEARPPADAVVGVRLLALAAPPRPAQLGLFDPPGPAPEALALTLARLAAMVGEGRVGAPCVPDTHRPLAVAVAPYAHAAPAPREDAAGREARVALHVFRPPRAADVVVAGGQMVRVSAGDIAGSVRVCCGPFRVAGEWWGEPFDHDGYDVELSDGGIYLVGFDRLASVWRVEGVYE